MEFSYYKSLEPFWGSWSISKQLGEGSFGKVFEIVREDFGSYRAALKIISIPQSESEWKSIMADGMDYASATSYFKGFVKEITAEIDLMSRLKGHSNIVSYEDHSVLEHEDGKGWDILIRMELLIPFLDVVPKDRSMDRDKVIKLGIDMCSALEYCQTQKIIHRDIKPENIFVSRTGDYKLGDFGIARTVEKTIGALSKKGTYTYMAPEVYKGAVYDSTVDIYSLGIVLYRLVNRNRAPFLPPFPEPLHHNDREEALSRRFMGEAIPLPIDAQDELGQIILKACAYRKEDRYQTPDQMRYALEHLESTPLSIKKDMETSGVNVTEDSENIKYEHPDDGVESAVNISEQSGHSTDNTEDKNEHIEKKLISQENLRSREATGSSGKKNKKGLIIGIVSTVAALGIAVFVIINVFGKDQGGALKSGSTKDTQNQTKTTQNNSPTAADKGKDTKTATNQNENNSKTSVTPTPIAGENNNKISATPTPIAGENNNKTSATPTPTAGTNSNTEGTVEDRDIEYDISNFDELYDKASKSAYIGGCSTLILAGEDTDLAFVTSETIYQADQALFYKTSDESIAYIYIDPDDEYHVPMLRTKKAGKVEIRGVLQDYKASITVTVCEPSSNTVSTNLKKLYKLGLADKKNVHFDDYNCSTDLTISILDLFDQNGVDYDGINLLASAYHEQSYFPSIELKWDGRNIVMSIGNILTLGKFEITVLFTNSDTKELLAIVKIPVVAELA